ncbi:MAG TPA: hypothetical protein VM736_07745 [Gemmatimonadales bacterium]|nr:hypothetical protein [Gemmatimonadales bacterium]
MPRSVGVALAIFVSVALPLSAQSAGDLLGQGIRAYRALDYAVAAAVLRQSLLQPPPLALADSQRARALSYLAATELFRGRRDAATAAFCDLIQLDPRTGPDSLIFPPQVTNLFQAVRRATKAVRLEVPPVTELHARLERFNARLFTSALEHVTVALVRQDGTPVRTLYDGPVADSLLVKWDGLTAAGAPPVDGRYALRVVPHARAAEGAQPLAAALDIKQEPPDTLPWPAALTGSALLPERMSARPALHALAAGALGGATVAALPALVTRGSSGIGARFAVAAAVSVSGLVGLLSHHPGQPIAANIRANAAAHDAWQRRVDAVRAENISRRINAKLVVRASPATAAERGTP